MGSVVTVENEDEFTPVVVEEQASPPPLKIFYKINSFRVTLREYAHGLDAIRMVPAVLLHKLFRIPLASSSDDLTCHTLAPFEIPQGDFPQDVYEKMSPLLREMEDLGFTIVSYHDIDDGLHLTRTFLVTLINPASPHIVARVHLRIWLIREPARIALFSEFITRFGDGTFLWTVASKPDWLSPPTIQVIRRTDLAPSILLKIHEDALATRPSNVATDEGGAREVTEAHHATLRDFHLHRGVFVPRTESDQAQAMRVEQLMHEGNRHAAVLIELERTQKRRTSWGSAILILVVSLGLFIGVGATRWDWQFLWILIAILTFHEFGHYIAMRAFNYRNLKMFFIPLFGAAVMGQNFTAPAWKKVIVALAGPVPGIIVGIALGCAGWYYHHPLLNYAAILTLIINGLNLLPVFPLDGGRIAHTLFFSRNYVLDLGFRAVAAAILLLAGYFTSDRILLGLGVLLMLNIPSAYRIAKISSDLRREGISPEDSADTFVPTGIATRIIDRLKGALNKNTSNKLLAQHTLQVYETIATKRAGWPATIGYAVLHGFALLLAGASIMIFMTAQHHGLSSVVRQAMRQAAPKNVVSGAMIANEGVLNPTTLPAYTLVATLDNSAASRAVFTQIGPALGTTAAAERFGNSVIIALDDPNDLSREHWVDRLETYTTKLCAVSKASQIAMTMQCTAPSESAAKSIVDELQGYLGAPHTMALIAPWSPDDTRSPALRAKHQLARHTYEKLQTLRLGQYSQPALIALNEREEAALRHGDAAALEAIDAERKSIVQDLAVKSAQKLKQQSPSEIDVQLVDAYLAATDDMKTFQLDDAHARQLGAQMGQLPLAGTQPAARKTRYSARFGYATAAENTIMVHCSFVSPIDGAPALVKWLEQKECSHITYEFNPERAFSGEPPDQDLGD